MSCTTIEKPKFFKIEQQVSSALHSLAFERSEMPELINTVIELIRFQERCCSIDSRSALNVIYATAFIAWKSIKVDERLDIKLADFQNRFNLKANLKPHVCKLSKFLIDLCESVSWILNKKKLNKTFYFHIKYLLENSVSLLDDYMKVKNKEIDRNKEQTSGNLEIRVKRERPEFDDFQDNISDSEIDSYIRTDEEVRILKRIKSKLGF